MGFSMWCFLQEERGVFSRYPRTRYETFLLRESPLPRTAPSPARFAEVLVELEDRQLSAFHGIYCRKYELDAQGMIDREHERQVESCFMEVMSDALGSGPRAKVRQIAPHLARRTLDRIHFWTPDAGEIEALAQAINERAGFTAADSALISRLLAGPRR